MKQEHSHIREIVKELGDKQFNDHTRPIRYTKGYDDLLEYIEQQEQRDAALENENLKKAIKYQKKRSDAQGNIADILTVSVIEAALMPRRVGEAE